jgi:hypothetical protein
MECNCIKPCEECTCCFDDEVIEIDVYVPMPPKKSWETIVEIVKVDKGISSDKKEST